MRNSLERCMSYWNVFIFLLNHIQSSYWICSIPTWSRMDVCDQSLITSTHFLLFLALKRKPVKYCRSDIPGLLRFLSDNCRQAVFSASKDDALMCPLFLTTLPSGPFCSVIYMDQRVAKPKCSLVQKMEHSYQTGSLLHFTIRTKQNVRDNKPITIRHDCLVSSATLSLLTRINERIGK